MQGGVGGGQNHPRHVETQAEGVPNMPVWQRGKGSVGMVSRVVKNEEKWRAHLIRPTHISSRVPLTLPQPFWGPVCRVFASLGRFGALHIGRVTWRVGGRILAILAVS